MPYQVIGSPDGKKEKKIGKPVKSKKYADARAAELADTHKKTGGKYRSEYTEATYPSDFRNADGSKRAVAKKKTGRPNAQGPESGKKEINERADMWHPDPEKDRKLGGPGANQRAREDRAAASKPKSDPKKLKKGESYMDYAKRQKKSSVKYSPELQKRLDAAKKKKEGLGAKIKRKLGLGESYDKPAERLKTDRDMFNISKADQEAAKKRLLAKAAAKRAAKMKKESVEMTEDRAADAKASLEKVKARQKVLDAHEKKTGKKLDINKSVEARDHKKNFPGAKRTGKKVKGAKETPLETHNRRVNKYSERLRKYGKTKKQDREDKAMAKHTSRFD